MDELERLLKDNPIILDKDFQDRFPKIIDVAMFLGAVSVASCRKTGRYELFDRLGIGSVGEYLELLRQGDNEAVGSYGRIRDIIRGGDSGKKQCVAD